MSDHSPEPTTTDAAPAGRFAFLSRLLGRFRAKPAAAEVPDESGGEPPAAAKESLLNWLLARFRKSPPADADSTAAPAVADEPAADATDAAAAPAAEETVASSRFAAIRSLFDSPLKIALVAASVLLLLLLVVLLVVLLGRKSAKHPPAAAPAAVTGTHKAEKSKAAAEPAEPHAAVPEKHATPEHSATPEKTAAEESKPAEAESHPSGKLEKPLQLIHDPLAEERAKLAEERAALEKERAQLEVDRKALTEQAGRAVNGAVVGRSGAAGPTGNLAGKCDLSGDKSSLRDNLRRCLGLPDKPEAAKEADAAAKGDDKPAGKAAAGKSDKEKAATH